MMNVWGEGEKGRGFGRTSVWRWVKRKKMRELYNIGIWEGERESALGEKGGRDRERRSAHQNKQLFSSGA